jgi:hypothetical protein
MGVRSAGQIERYVIFSFVNRRKDLWARGARVFIKGGSSSCFPWEIANLESARAKALCFRRKNCPLIQHPQRSLFKALYLIRSDRIRTPLASGLITTAFQHQMRRKRCRISGLYHLFSCDTFTIHVINIFFATRLRE